MLIGVLGEVKTDIYSAVKCKIINFFVRFLFFFIFDLFIFLMCITICGQYPAKCIMVLYVGCYCGTAESLC